MAVTISQKLSLLNANEATQKQPIDDRFGPWNSVEQATNALNATGRSRTYYGMTIGVRVFDEVESRSLLGVDEYWWQPACIYDETLNSGEGGWKDGFIRKYQSNNFAQPGQVMGEIDDADSEHPQRGVEWKNDDTEQQWNSLDAVSSNDSSEVIDELYP